MNTTTMIETTDYTAAQQSGRQFWWIIACPDGYGGITDQIDRQDGRIVLYASHGSALAYAIDANAEGRAAIEQGDLSSWDDMHPVLVLLLDRKGAWQVAPVDLIGTETYAYANPCYRNCIEE